MDSVPAGQIRCGRTVFSQHLRDLAARDDWTARHDNLGKARPNGGSRNALRRSPFGRGFFECGSRGSRRSAERVGCHTRRAHCIIAQRRPYANYGTCRRVRAGSRCLGTGSGSGGHQTPSASADRMARASIALSPQRRIDQRRNKLEIGSGIRREAGGGS